MASICVFCSSSNRVDDEYLEAAREAADHDEGPLGGTGVVLLAGVGEVGDEGVVEHGARSLGSGFELRGEPRDLLEVVSADVAAVSDGILALTVAEAVEALASGGDPLAVDGLSVRRGEEVSHNADRPLLKGGDPREILARLMEHRYPVYEQADIVVDSVDAPAEVTVPPVLDALEAYPAAAES